MICSSPNRLRFIRPSPPQGHGLYLSLEEFSGLTSAEVTQRVERGSTVSTDELMSHGLLSIHPPNTVGDVETPTAPG